MTITPWLRGAGVALVLAPFYSIDQWQWWVLLIGSHIILWSLDCDA